METALIRTITSCYVNNARGGVEKETEVLRDAVKSGDIARISSALKKREVKKYLRRVSQVIGFDPQNTLSMTGRRTYRENVRAIHRRVDAVIHQLQQRAA